MSTSELKEHKRSHGEYPYTCKRIGCGLSFKMVKELELHILTDHKGKEPFKYVSEKYVFEQCGNKCREVEMFKNGVGSICSARKCLHFYK